MTERYRDQEPNEALDPEALYSKEYCIGWSCTATRRLGVLPMLMMLP